MHTSPIQMIRNAGAFVRCIAGVVVVTFSMLILTPTAMAAQQAYKDNKQQQIAAPDDEAKLSRALQKVDELLRKVNTKLQKGQDALPEEDELKKLKKEIKKLDKSVTKNFEKVEEHLKDKGMSEIILNRHYDMVKNYRTEMKTMMKNLDDLEVSEDKEAKKKMAKKAHEHMKGKKHKRSHQPFDPNNLPHKAIKPNRKNKPKKSKKEFHQAGLFDNPKVKLATLGDFTYDKLVGASDPAYLAETDEVNLSDAIKAKAAELNHDPIQIYNFVRNNTGWLPTWGAIQDSDLTLGSLRGNAFDISSLLIALYRASGIPARYVHGTIDVPVDKFMNWAGGFTDPNAAANFASAGGIPIADVISGGKITKFRIEHIWVEAAIDFQPSRGAVNKSADSWVAIDPSYKQYEYLTGLDVIDISSVDPVQLVQDFLNSGTVNETEGWVSGFDAAIIQNAQAQNATDLETYIRDNLTNPTEEDVIGGRKSIIRENLVLPSSIANKVVVLGTRYGAIPTTLQHHIAFSFQSFSGYFNADVSFPWAKLNNQKITLSFKPASPDDEVALLAILPEGEVTDINQIPMSISSYLINVVPELKVNGNIVLTGNAIRLGEDMPFAYEVTMPNQGSRVHPSPVVAGSYLSLGVVGGSIAKSKLLALLSTLSNTRTVLESGDATLIAALNREDMLGDVFYAGSLGYFLQYATIGSISASQQQHYMILAPSAGTFGYEPEVDYLFGFPRNITTGGVAMNMDRVANIVEVEGSAQDKKNFVIQLGILSSSLEHSVPEQMFVTPENPGEAISAVKAMTKALAAGQKVYHITPANQASTLPNINHRSETMDEIQTALAMGKEVITHTDAVTVSGWKGAGYIIIDPDTGAGAYKIGGGKNGGLLLAAISVLLAALSIFGGLAAFLGIGAYTILFISLVAVILSFSVTLDSLSGCGGDIGLAAAFTSAVITAIPGKGASILRFFLSGFILSEGFTTLENNACELIN